MKVPILLYIGSPGPTKEIKLMGPEGKVPPGPTPLPVSPATLHVYLTYHKFVMLLVMQNVCKNLAPALSLHLCKNVGQVQNGRLTPCRYGAWRPSDMYQDPRKIQDPGSGILTDHRSWVGVLIQDPVDSGSCPHRLCGILWILDVVFRKVGSWESQILLRESYLAQVAIRPLNKRFWWTVWIFWASCNVFW